MIDDHHLEFRRCLSECDVTAIRKLWRHIYPNLHQPSSDSETLATIHLARTQSVWLDIKSRAYSHNWLLDHGLPSALPDDLKPKAEQICPRIVEGVGIAVKTLSSHLKPAAKLIQQTMSDVVLDAYAEKLTDPTVIKKRMMEARKITITRLFGQFIP